MVLWFALAGFVGACSASDDASVLILGDSLSAGYGIDLEQSWPSLLQQRLQGEGYGYRVVNASISGETTSGGARRIAALLAQHAPGVVVVALGANDGLRGIRPAEIEKNLARIVNAVKATGATPVLLRVRIPPNYGPGYTDAFESVFDRIADDDDVVYGPFMLERFAANRAAFQNDGLHPTAASQPLILETLWPSISGALSSPSGLEEFF